MTRAAALIAGVAIVASVGALGAHVVDDAIRVVNQAGQAVADVRVFVSGARFGGCFCQVAELKNLHLGNITSRTQVAVLSKSYALFFAPDVTWQYWADEVYTATVRPLVTLPLVVWKLSAIEKTSAKDVKFAEQQFAAHPTGLRLSSKIRDVTKAGITTAGCLDAATLKNTPDPNNPTRSMFEPGAVNIYYVDGCGANCADGGRLCLDDPQVGFVYPIGSNTTLLHELGHALLGAEGTRHWKLSVSEDNIMRDSTANFRATITTGQAIAMNYEKTSVLGPLKLQAQALECRIDCPQLEFDESWSGCQAPASTDVPAPDPLDLWLDCLECDGGEFARVVNAPSTPSLVPRLRSALQPNQLTSAWALQIEDIDYRSTAIARHQKRALQALQVLAMRPNEPARNAAREAIREAYQVPQTQYRIDVRAAIASSFVVIQ